MKLCQTEEMKMKKMLCVLMVLCLAGAASADLVAYYNFEEGSGVVAADSSGYGNAANGIKGGAGTISWIPGKVGNYAASLDGASYFNCGKDSKFDITGQISIAAWIKSTPNHFFEMLVSKGNGAGWRVCELVNADSMFWGVNGDNANIGGSITALDDTWHHVAVTYDETADLTRMYIDGAKEEASYSWPILTNNYDVVLGANAELGYGFNWFGAMDDVRIYNHALTEAEVQALVPEPITMSFLGLGALALLRRRR
jgi:uncharacterized protein (TIGR03382 family)